MAMPTDVGIVDTMIGFPHKDMKATYRFITNQTKDRQSKEDFEFPVEYMFKNVPEKQFREADDPIAVTVRRGVEAYRRHPHYAELFLDVAASRDPYAVATFGRMSDGVSDAMLASVGGADSDLGREIVAIVGNAWLGGLFACVHGRSDFAGLEDSLDVACRLLLAGAETAAPA